jgi:chromatin remodeling complex protein RSC6
MEKGDESEEEMGEQRHERVEGRVKDREPDLSIFSDSKTDKHFSQAIDEIRNQSEEEIEDERYHGGNDRAMDQETDISIFPS